jgi:hypothetical protein
LQHRGSVRKRTGRIRRGAGERGRAVVPVDVAAADATCGDPNQEFLGPWPWTSEVGHFQLVILGKKQRLHMY